MFASLLYMYQVFVLFLRRKGMEHRYVIAVFASIFKPHSIAT